MRPRHTPRCPRCKSTDTQSLRNFGRPVEGRFDCLSCKRWFGPSNPADAGGTGVPGPVPTPTQADVLRNMLAAGDERIHREAGGFWVTRITRHRSDRSDMWEWFATVQTIRAMEKRGWLVRCGTHVAEWADDRTFTAAGRIEALALMAAMAKRKDG